MVINIDDCFLSKEERRFSPDPLSSFPVRMMNYQKVFALSDRDFSEFYLKLMEEYRDKDGWWGERGTPYCSKCNEEISSPKDLRRYCGRSLHPNCFSEEMQSENVKNSLLRNKTMKKYFERVAKLDLSLLDE